jgi:superfamily II DNA or RNA helicase
MARLSIFADDVQTVVHRLVPILLASGNVAGVVRVLNQALASAGVTTRLHANRISALLSDDVARGVNEATLTLVQTALDQIDPETFPSEPLIELKRRAQALKEPSGADLNAIADQLQVPRAAVRTALFGEGSHFALASGAAPAHLPMGGPDWSYQDIAVARVHDAFRRRPDGRIGLVLPTGAGKTRVALRIILEVLRDAEPGARVIWVTHRKTLKRQAFRQLGKLLQSKTPLPAEADRLANRIVFAMVGEVTKLIAEGNIALIVIDEAHHAAAPSYGAMFEPRPPCPVLLLTATPNRPDALPIWVEEIAFTITYRELAAKGTILIPEFLPFEVEDFDWQPQPREPQDEDDLIEVEDDPLADLVDWLIDETSDRFRKVLLLAPRVDRVEEFYARFIEQLQHEVGHPLTLDDVGYIHGGGNSLGIADEDFLERFEDKPRAVLVSAQMLLEGFDDPAIDTVVLTYPTSSVIRLMQAAGRAVRQHPGKTKAYVVQASNADLAYRFDQRWLYQELHDYLRPEIIDMQYGAPGERRHQIEALLDRHRVTAEDRAKALSEIDALAPDAEIRLLFYGKPYFGDAAQFQAHASWSVFVETPTNSAAFRELFNGFSAMGAQQSDPTDYLSKTGPALGVAKDLTPGSTWRKLGMVLTASYCAREELYGTPSYGLQGTRPSPRQGPTSWLRYVTFSFEPQLPEALESFLADCHNRLALEVAYLEGPDLFAAAIKVPLPLGGSEGLLLPPDIYQAFEARRGALSAQLRLVAPRDRYQALAAHLATGEALPLPQQFAARIETLLGDGTSSERILTL